MATTPFLIALNSKISAKVIFETTSLSSISLAANEVKWVEFAKPNNTNYVWRIIGILSGSANASVNDWTDNYGCRFKNNTSNAVTLTTAKVYWIGIHL